MGRRGINATIYLTGFMGAGKTTVGERLGEILTLDVFDTDKVIEGVCEKSISDIFADEGEAYFREYEESTIKKLSRNRVIITTGGGVVENEGIRTFMKENGISIYLHCDPKVIMSRLEGDVTRPLLQEKKPQAITAIFEARLPYYLEADYTINTTMKSVGAIVSEIGHLLDRHEWVGS